MTTLTKHIIGLLNEAITAATLEKAGFGFPNDRIEIKSVHFGDETKGNVGDVLHPDAYIKRMVKLHHETWIIARLRQAVAVIEANAELFERLQDLAADMQPHRFERIQHLIEACSKQRDAAAGQF